MSAKTDCNHTVRHTIVETHAKSRLSNSQTPGIGRLAAFDDLLLVNNLGRNICSAVFDGRGQLKTLASFDETLYPDLDDEQQFDIDMHCFLRWNERLIAINHYGMVRFFDWSDLTGTEDEATAAPASLSPRLAALWPGDAERFAVARSTLLSTSPMGYAVESPAENGLLVSEPLDRLLHSQESGEEPLAVSIPYRKYLEDWGTTTALAVDEERARSAVAVAAGCRLGVFELNSDSHGFTDLGHLIYEGVMPFSVTFLQFASETKIVAAGHDPVAEEAQAEEWDMLTGGGFASIDLSTRELSAYRFGAGVDLAFGNGADPLVMADRQGGIIYGVDRFANLYSWSIAGGERRVLSRTETGRSRGLAHMALFQPSAGALNESTVAPSIFCGFNRDGYRLHHYQI